MQNLERRCSDMQEEINVFRKRFDILLNKGFPSPLLSEDKLMDLESYVEKLDKHANNHASTSTSSSTTALPTGKSLHDRLENLFYLEHEVKHLFPVQLTFFRYTETDETLRKLQRTRILEDKWWEELLELL